MYELSRNPLAGPRSSSLTDYYFGTSGIGTSLIARLEISPEDDILKPFTIGMYECIPEFSVKQFDLILPFLGSSLPFFTKRAKTECVITKDPLEWAVYIREDTIKFLETVRSHLRAKEVEEQEDFLKGKIVKVRSSVIKQVDRKNAIQALKNMQKQLTAFKVYLLFLQKNWKKDWDKEGNTAIFDEIQSVNTIVRSLILDRPLVSQLDRTIKLLQLQHTNPEAYLKAMLDKDNSSNQNIFDETKGLVNSTLRKWGVLI